MSFASSDGVAYLRLRSFSIAFITIQSRSPLKIPTRRLGSVPRAFAVFALVSRDVLTLVLGRGGSYSRRRRNISSNEHFFHCFVSKGGEPARSAYRTTPSEYTSVRVSTSEIRGSVCSGLM